jgi:hypothetical protein
MVRELCATKLRVAALGSPPEYLHEAGWPWWRRPVNLILETLASDPNPRIDGNRLVGELLVRAPPVCLGPPCKVWINQLSGLSPLSKTTYPTSHDIPLWCNFVKIIIWLIVCTTMTAIVAYLVIITSTRTWAKILKVRIHYLVSFWQINPLAKSHAWLEVKSFL